MPVGASNWERLGVWALGLLVVAASLGVGYVGTPHTPSPEAVAAVEADPHVTVTEMGEGYVLAPGESAADVSGTSTATGLVFYPGARVHPDAYLPILAPVVARTGVTVFVPKPPLYLAVFDPDMAGPIIGSHPEIDQWVVGGHSLGGAMACRFAAGHPEHVSGLVLLGSYCDRDLAGTGIRVLSVQGGADTVVDRAALRRNRANLPPNATEAITIEGMNHTQFGAYAGQRGDSPATITDERAHEALRTELVEFLRGT